MGASSITADPLPPAPYAGVGLDRVPVRRADPEWLQQRHRDPRSRVHPLYGGDCLIGSDGLPVTLSTDGFALEELVLLGQSDGNVEFAIDLARSEPTDADRPAALGRARATGTAALRSLYDRLPAAEAGLLACARGVLGWNRDQRFCGRCATATEPRQAGFARWCPRCERLLFPRIEPAVITLVETLERPRRCLLARHRASTTGAFSLLAGFVEIGESLEDAVHREITEEVGVRLDEVRYAGSQPWPFPSGMMIAFRARAPLQDVTVDGEEIAAARWFTREEMRADAASVPALGRPDSIDRLLLTAWLTESDPND